MKNKSRFEKGFDPGTKPRIGQANKGEKCKPFFFFLRKKQNKIKNYHPLIPLPLVPIQTLGLN